MLPTQPTIPAFDALPALSDAELESIATHTRETLHDLLAKHSLAPATISSYASALRYWDAWHRASTGDPIHLLREPRVPVPTATVCAFIAHHAPRVMADGSTGLAMPPVVLERMKQLRAIGKRLASRRAKRTAEDVPTLATVRHRIAALSSCHNLAGLKPPFAESMDMRRALSALSNLASEQAPEILRQPKKAIDRKTFNRMIEACTAEGTATGVRDAALLHVAFDTGGRRRSELAGMRWDDLRPIGEGDEELAGLDGYHWMLRSMKGAKRDVADGGVHEALILGDAADALDRWRDIVRAANLPADGPVWYRTVKSPEGRGMIPSTPLIPVDVWHIVRARAAAVGVDPKNFGAHSLRSGAATTLLTEGEHLADVSNMLGHKRIETTRKYYDQRKTPVAAVVRHAKRHMRKP